MNSYEFNENKKDDAMNSKIQEANFILVSIPPVNNEDIVVKNFKEIIKTNMEMDNLLISDKCLWKSRR